MQYKLNNNPFLCDLRSLALMRILISAIVISSSIHLLVNFNNLLSSDGISAYQNQTSPLTLNWSLYYISNSDIWTLSLLVLTIISALMMGLGYRVQITTFITWALSVSFYTKFSLIGQCCDTLISLILFWGIFLPWDQYFTISKNNKKNYSPDYFDWAIGGYAIQVIYLYLFTALLKTGDVWSVNGSALYLALSIDQLTTSFAKWMLDKSSYIFLQISSLAVYYLELLIPILLLIPYRIKTFRIFSLMILTILHLSILATFRIGNFPLICLASLVGLLPSSLWEMLKIKLNYDDKQPKESTNYQFRYIFYLLIIIVTFININSVTRSWQKDSLKLLRNISLAFHLDQNWTMFAPFPLTDDGWYIFKGTFEDGNNYDVFYDRKITYEKPKNFDEMFPNYRWGKYLENYRRSKNENIKKSLILYLCNKYNKQNETNKLMKVDVEYVLEITRLPSQNAIKNTTQTLFAMECP